MVGDHAVGTHVQELHAGPAVDDVLRGGLVAVAAVVPEAEGILLLVRRPGGDDLAGLQIVHFGDARHLPPRQLAAEHLAVDDEHVHGEVEAFVAGGGPEFLARLGGECDHLAAGEDVVRRDSPLQLVHVLPTGVDGLVVRAVGGEHDPVRDDQRRDTPGIAMTRDRPGGAPQHVTRGRLQRQHVVFVFEEEAAVAYEQGQREDVGDLFVFLFPQQLAGFGVECADMLGHELGDVFQVPVSPQLEPPDDLARRGAWLVQRLADYQVERSVAGDDLVRVGRAFVGADHLAGGGVQGGDRLAVAERDVDAVADGHQAPGQFGRAAAEGAELIFPRPDRLFPQQHAAEGVPRHQHPLRGGLHRGDRPLVGDVEQAPGRRHHGADAGQVIVASGPARPGHPLHVTRRSDPRIESNGVVVGAVQEMRPLVDFGRPPLRGLLPSAVGLQVGDAQGGQHAHDLVCGDLGRRLDDQQIDSLIRVG